MTLHLPLPNTLSLALTLTLTLTLTLALTGRWGVFHLARYALGPQRKGQKEIGLNAPPRRFRAEATRPTRADAPRYAKASVR